MSDFNLSGAIDVDVGDAVSGATDASDAFEDLGDSADETTESLIDLDSEGLAVAGALGGAGAAMQRNQDKTRDMREELNRAGQAAGFTQGEMTDLATSLSDGTLETEEASRTLAELSQQGIDTEEGLADLTATSDTLADAIGEDADVIAGQLGPSMAAVGDDIEDMEEVQDAVAVAVNESTLEFDELTRQMERNSEELQDLGMDTQDTAVAMSAFADETGLSGRELRREFDQALQEADGNMDEFHRTTGISEDQLAEHRAEVEANEGAAAEYSKAVSENTTLMDDLRVSFSDAQLQLGNFLGPITAAAPALQGLAGAQALVSTVNFSAVVPSFTAAAAAAAPLILPILAITAAAGALFVAWDRNILGVRDIAQDAFGEVSDIVERVGDMLPNTVGEATDQALRIFERWHPAGIVWSKREEILDALPSARDALRSGRDFVGGFADGVRDAIPDVTGTVDDLTDRVRSFLPSSPADEGPLSDLDKAGEALPETLADGMESGQQATTQASESTAASAAPSGGGGADMSAVVEELRALRDAVESDDSRRVREQDLVAGLQRLFDRHGHTL